MKVSVLTPTLRRPEFLRRAIQQYNNQDYPDKELILIIDKEDFWTVEWIAANTPYQSDMTIYTMDGIAKIGQKRNSGCHIATGEIIVHMDDDDIYADDWVSKSVEALLKCNGNVTGLSRAYFKQGEDFFLWSYPVNAQPYVCGATMCYYREQWERNNFPGISMEEEKLFCANAIVRPHGYIDGFTAIIHGGNTCGHLALPYMQNVTPAPLPEIS